MSADFKIVWNRFAFSTPFDKVMCYSIGEWDKPVVHWHRVAFGLYYKTDHWMPRSWCGINWYGV